MQEKSEKVQRENMDLREEAAHIKATLKARRLKQD